MNTGYYTNTGAMITQFNRLDTISNNLANINTAGFKKDATIIGNYLAVFQENRDNMPIEDQTRKAAKFYNRALNKTPQIVEKYTNFSIGAFDYTGNTLDVALRNKDLFFIVQTPTGNQLTRNGAFNVNSDRQVITRQGYLVLGGKNLSNLQPIRIDAGLRVNFDKDGKIYQENDIPFNQLAIVQVKNLKNLKKMGNNLLSVDLNSEKVTLNQNSKSVSQNYLEKSNVNGVTEIVGLIETNRLVQMYQKAMDTEMNEINQEAIKKLTTAKNS